MKVSRLSSGRGIGEPVRGPALVSQQGFGVRYDLEPARGVIANPNHDLFGHAIGGLGDRVRAGEQRHHVRARALLTPLREET